MPPEVILLIKSLLVLSVFIGCLVLERLFPFSDTPLLLRMGQWGKAAWQRLAKHGVLFGFNALLSPMLVVPVTAFAVSHQWGWRPDWLQGWFGIVIDCLLLDLWIYWWHRANHEIPFLWRFHIVHHLDETLDSTSAFRFHFGEVALSACVRMIPIFLLGMSLTSVILFEGILLASALFHHSAIALPASIERWLSKIIITPGIHWIHHHARREDTDSNYGALLSIWDPLFGSRSKTRRESDMVIGVANHRDRGIVGLLLTPFRRMS